MPTLEVLDTVVLKSHRHLVGVVDRTHYENDALHDTLIIAHVPVDQAAITEFVTTGSPPKGHVFVRFANEAHGSALVREDDVELLDRTFNLGDLVKKDDGQMLGSVVSVDETYLLQPVWVATLDSPLSCPLVTIDLLETPDPHVCSSDCPFGPVVDVACTHQDLLLHNIPAEELKKAEDALEGDLLVQNEWVGVVEEVEQIVVVLLEDDSVVVIKEPEELYIPVADSGKPLVSLPEFDNLMRPDALVALQGWAATIPPQALKCGQLVITNHRNLRQGRWLRGQYNPNIKPQGHILDVKTKSLEVKWLACNAFIPERPISIDWPSTHVTLYDNINTFPKRSELRSNKQVSIYDQHRVPRTSESRARSSTTIGPASPTVRSSTDFQVGDHVKFRDQAGAALKYQGVTSSTGNPHGQFDRIASALTHGFDVNELRILSSRQQSTVLWQDGTTSKHMSKNLIKFHLFELDLAPADLVVAREGMKQQPVSRLHTLKKESRIDHSIRPTVDFNEMKFFEQPHNLLPSRVGVVQNVDQKERVAQVRWFADPHICLQDYGQILSPSSRFGRLSTSVEDVSLYEIMTFPALQRTLRDPAIIPPGTVSSATLDYWKGFRDTKMIESIGQATLSMVNATTAYDLLNWLQCTAHILTQDSAPRTVLDSQAYKLHPANDWVGEIVALGLDGTVTVRLNTREMCKDVRLEHDQIICIIDEPALNGPPFDQDANIMDSDMDYSLGDSEDADSVSTISETVEYEGGERIDDDSGDENWEDADDDDIEMKDTTTPLPSTRTVTPLSEMVSIDHAQTPNQHNSSHQKASEPSAHPYRASHESMTSVLKSSLPTEAPSSFAVLEREPPADQYQNHIETFTSSPAFLKRVIREHRILASSLPRGEIYVRTYENRLDLLRCLIIGPADTPYEYAPFLIDLQLGRNFPREPPTAHFHSWTSGLGRINPNLYEEGKICLSLLGTWPGKAENESWSEKATILQVLVSLQGLVFVRQPFYNEAGFEGHAEGGAYNLEAQRYNEKAYLMARGFVKHALAAPVQGLEDVLAWIYLPHGEHVGLLNAVISRSHRLIEHSEKSASDESLLDGTGSPDDETRVFLKPLSRGAIVMLRKTIRLLEQSTTAYHGAGKSATEG